MKTSALGYKPEKQEEMRGRRREVQAEVGAGFTRQGIEELKKLRSMGATRAEASAIVEQYEQSRAAKIDSVNPNLRDFEPIMCYSDSDGKIRPMETDYTYRKKIGRALQQKAAERVRHLEKSSASITSLHENVEIEYEKFAGELHQKCIALHAVIQQREKELMARLEHHREVK